MLTQCISWCTFSSLSCTSCLMTTRVPNRSRLPCIAQGLGVASLSGKAKFVPHRCPLRCGSSSWVVLLLVSHSAWPRITFSSTPCILSLGTKFQLEAAVISVTLNNDFKMKIKTHHLSVRLFENKGFFRLRVFLMMTIITMRRRPLLAQRVRSVNLGVWCIPHVADPMPCLTHLLLEVFSTQVAMTSGCITPLPQT